MIDMAVNKIVYGTTVLVDLTSDSVTADALETGKTAHGKDGNIVTGKNPYVKATTDAAVNTQAALIDQIMTALDGKVAGGGGGAASTPTCSVTIEAETDDRGASVEFMVVLDDGSVSTGYIDFHLEGAYKETVHNVVQDSPIIIYTDATPEITDVMNCYVDYIGDGIGLLKLASGEDINEWSFSFTTITDF